MSVCFVRDLATHQAPSLFLEPNSAPIPTHPGFQDTLLRTHLYQLRRREFTRTRVPGSEVNRFPACKPLLNVRPIYWLISQPDCHSKIWAVTCNSCQSPLASLIAAADYSYPLSARQEETYCRNCRGALGRPTACIKGVDTHDN